MLQADQIISNTATFVSILIRIFVTIRAARYLLPLQYRQAQVKNGLGKLRYWMLVQGIIIFLLNVASIYLLFIAIGYGNIINASKVLQVLNALGFLAIVEIQIRIYHQQYIEKH